MQCWTSLFPNLPHIFFFMSLSFSVHNEDLVECSWEMLHEFIDILFSAFRTCNCVYFCTPDLALTFLLWVM